MKQKPLSFEDAFDPIDWEEMERLAKVHSSQRITLIMEKSEMIRSDLRNKLTEDFPALSLPEINMKVLRSLTPVRMGKSTGQIPPLVHGSRLLADSLLSPQGFHALRQSFSPHRRF